MGGWIPQLCRAQAAREGCGWAGPGCSLGQGDLPAGTTSHPAARGQAALLGYSEGYGFTPVAAAGAQGGTQVPPAGQAPLPPRRPCGQGAGHVGSLKAPSLRSHRVTNPVFWEGGNSSKYLRRGRGEATQASGSSAERCPGRRQISAGTGQSPRGARGSPGAGSRRAGVWGRGRTRSSSRAQAAGEGVGGVYFQTGRCPGGSKPPGERGTARGAGGRRGQAGRGREART